MHSVLSRYKLSSCRACPQNPVEITLVIKHRNKEWLDGEKGRQLGHVGRMYSLLPVGSEWPHSDLPPPSPSPGPEQEVLMEVLIM